MTVTRPSNKPNILIMVIDSLRADHVSCYGYHRETTPNIDRLAAEGCVFEAAISAAPFSPASYASIFSNLYPHQHGVNGDTVRVWPDTWPRLPEQMQGNGYYTFGVSNNSFVSAEMNATRGFHVFVGPRQSWMLRQHNRLTSRLRKYVGDRTARLIDSSRLLSQHKGDSNKAIKATKALIQGAARPFFGVIILMDPHAVYNPSRRDFCTDARQVKAFFRHVSGRQMWPRVMARRAMLSSEELRVAIDLYDGEILYADRCVGQLCEWLGTQHLLDDTILVITSDHGEAFGEHGVWGHGFCLNDCVTRVPLVLGCRRYWTPGTRTKGLVQLHDIHDLCLSVANTGEPSPGEFAHCLTQASDPNWTERTSAFSEFSVQHGSLEFFRRVNPDFVPGQWGESMWAIRSQDWRYIEYGNGGQELYDLRADQGERTSVHTEHFDVCAELQRRLQAHRDDRPCNLEPEEAPQQVDETVLERLRALGYIE